MQLFSENWTNNIGIFYSHALNKEQINHIPTPLDIIRGLKNYKGTWEVNYSYSSNANMHFMTSETAGHVAHGCLSKAVTSPNLQIGTVQSYCTKKSCAKN